MHWSCAASCQVPNSFEELLDFLLFRVSLVVAQANKDFTSGSILLMGTGGGMALVWALRNGRCCCFFLFLEEITELAARGSQVQTWDKGASCPYAQLEDPEQLSARKYTTSDVYRCLVLLL